MPRLVPWEMCGHYLSELPSELLGFTMGAMHGCNHICKKSLIYLSLLFFYLSIKFDLRSLGNLIIVMSFLCLGLNI